MQAKAVPAFKSYVRALTQHALDFFKHFAFYAIDWLAYVLVYYVVPYGVTFFVLGYPLQFGITVVGISIASEWTAVFLCMVVMCLANVAATALRQSKDVALVYVNHIGMLEAAAHFCQTLLLYNRYDPWLHFWIYVVNTFLVYKTNR